MTDPLVSTFVVLQHVVPNTGELVNIAVVIRPSTGPERVYYDPMFYRARSVSRASPMDLARDVDLYWFHGTVILDQVRVATGGFLQDPDDDAEVGSVVERYLGPARSDENEGLSSLLLDLHETGIQQIAQKRGVSITEARAIFEQIGEAFFDDVTSSIALSPEAFDVTWSTDTRPEEPDLATMDTVEDVVVPTLSPAPPVLEDDGESDCGDLW